MNGLSLLITSIVALAPVAAPAATTDVAQSAPASTAATDTIRGIFGATPTTLPASFAGAFLAQVP